MASRRYTTSEDNSLHAKFLALEDRVKALESGAGLGNSSITKGGFAVRSGADLNIANGGDIVVSDGGSVIVEGGSGGVEVRDGGSIKAEYPNGELAVEFGSSIFPASEYHSGYEHGLIVRDEDGRNLLRAVKPLDDRGLVWVGSDTHGVQEFDTTSDIAVIRATEEASFILAIGSDPIDSQVICRSISAPAQLLSDDSQAVVSGGTDAIVNATNGTAALQSASGDVLVFATGSISLSSSSNQVFITHTTTGSAANCFISTGGLIQRSTSSIKYKQDIEDFTVDNDKILQLRPRVWRDKQEVEEDGDTDNKYFGLIAEEVSELGLTYLVSYDEEGNPDGVAYDRLAVALLNVVRQQKEQIESLIGVVGVVDEDSKPKSSMVVKSVRLASQDSPTTPRSVFSLPETPNDPKRGIRNRRPRE